MNVENLKSLIKTSKTTGEIFNQFYKKTLKYTFPLTICINEELYNYTDNKDIPENCIIKFEFGDSKGEMFGDTVLIGKEFDKLYNKYAKSLDKIKKAIIENKSRFDTNDELKLFIEDQCEKRDLVCIKNNISYQRFENKIFEQDSKYIITNYQKEFNEDDYLIQENECFDITNNESYNINLTVMPKEFGNEWFWLKLKKDTSDIYKLNDIFNGLKLKDSKKLLNEIKGSNGFYAFLKDNFYHKHKLGFSECVEKNLLFNFEKQKLVHTKGIFIPIFFKKFTLNFFNNE